MHDITLISPGQLDGAGEQGDFPLDAFALRFLAQGDSWFSIGAIPPFLTSNLFDQLVLSQAAVAVNCARPGAELQHMTDSTTNRVFLQLLSGRRARPWTALLLSGLGNDVISATQAGPAFPPGQRLLATRAEWAAGGDAGRYLSAEGWDTFCRHAKAVFAVLLHNRDRTAINRGLPIVLHTYDVVTPHDAGAGAGFGPWLFPAMQAFQVPQADWAALGAALLGRARRLILDIAASEPTVRVVDTQGTLTPAATTDTGPTVHWQNEIHPTRTGYRLLGDRWEQELERWFCTP